MANINDDNIGHILTGTDELDVISGNGGDDVIYGLGSGDYLYGQDGNDAIYGGDGYDQIIGGVGDDTLEGGEGNDTIGEFAVNGIDTLRGGGGDDQLYGDSGDTFDTGSGSDLIGMLLRPGFSANLSFGDGADSFQVDVGSGLVLTATTITADGGAGIDTFAAINSFSDLAILIADRADQGGQAGSIEYYTPAANPIAPAATVRKILLTGFEVFNLVGANLSTITTGDGDDTIAVGIFASPGQTVFAGGGADSVTGSGFLYGEAGADTLVGGAYANLLVGGDGNDVLRGGVSNDTLDGGQGDDFLDSGGSGPYPAYLGGPDIVSFYSAASGVTVDLAISGAQDTGQGFDTLVGFQSLNGSRFGDTLYGDGAGNRILGVVSTAAGEAGIGGDHIYGRGGADTIAGGSGADYLDGGDGDDVLYAGADTGLYGYGEIGYYPSYGSTVATPVPTGDDTLLGGAGADTLNGGDGSDSLSGGDANDVMTVGVGGADTIDGGAGQDLLSYSTASANLTIDLRISGAQTVAAASALTVTGVEDLIGGSGGNTLIGHDGSNRLTGGVGADWLQGMGGSDQLFGYAGADTLDGGDGDDVLDGGSDFLSGDAFRGGQGTDAVTYASAYAVTINLRSGQGIGAALGDSYASIEEFRLSNNQFAGDTFIGDTAGVRILGLDGMDSLTGGDGDDFIVGGASNDSLTGGLGGDTFVYESLNDFGFFTTYPLVEKINDFGNGADRLDLSAINGAATLSSFSSLIFIGRSAFSHVAGQVRYDNSGSAGTRLFIDTLGNGVGGQILYLEGVMSLAETSAGSNILYRMVAGAPVAVDDSFTTAESAVRAGNVLTNNGGGPDLDPDGGTLTVAAVNGDSTKVGHAVVLSGGGLFTLAADGSFTLDPAGAYAALSDGFNATETLTYTVVDAQGLTATALVTLTITGQGYLVINGTSGNDSLVGGPTVSTLNGLEGDDILEGRGGSDVLDGGAGFDIASYRTAALGVTINRATGMGAGDAGGDSYVSIEAFRLSNFGDVFIAGSGGWSVDAGDGWDRLTGGTGNDSLAGGAGDDSISGGGSGDDLLAGGEGADTLAGGAGADTILGGEGDDFIAGGSGANVLSGGEGADALIGGVDNDSFDGGAGSDFVSYSYAKGTLTIDLALAGPQKVADQGFDTFTGIERLIGSLYGDSNFYGNDDANIFNVDLAPYSSRNQLYGRGGDDWLIGSGGNDTLGGGAGNDTLEGQSGADTADYSDAVSGVVVDLNMTGAQNTGGGGTDTLLSIESLIGSNFADVLYGSRDLSSWDSFTLEGRGGDDRLVGGVGIGSLYGGEGDDVLVANRPSGSDASILDGGSGFDIADMSTVASIYFSLDLAAGTAQTGSIGSGYPLYRLIGVEGAIGGFYGDILKGGAENSYLSGGGGDDILDGRQGDDRLWGGGGNDTVDGGAGADTYFVSGARANYTVTRDEFGGFLVSDNVGADGADHIIRIETLQFSDKSMVLGPEPVTGTAAADDLFGSAQADYLFGYAGNDTLAGLLGDDVLSGGDGADVLLGGEGVDTADYSGSTSGVKINLGSVKNGYSLGLGGYAAGDQLQGVENIVGTAQGDILTGDGLDNALSGGLGDDSLSGGGGKDTVLGGDGMDRLFGDAGDDLLSGGAGDDTLDGGLDFDTADYSTTGSGVTIDLRVVGPQNTGGAGFDKLLSIEGVIGTNVVDVLKGADSATYLEGGRGNDTLDGRGGADTLWGGGGDDSLTGGAGDDILDGGGAVDTATFSGMRSNYAISDLGGGSLRVSDLRAGRPDGVDTLTTIEYLRFSDQTVASAQVMNGVTITGTAGADTISALKTAPGQLLATGGSDTLYGLGGNDMLDGAGGADAAYGGLGDDTFFVDNAADLTIELIGEGKDTVKAAVSFTLSDNVENLTLVGPGATTGTGNALSNKLVGNDAANSLYGLDGKDSLDGGGGGDLLYGGGGDDSYDVDNVLDQVIELAGGGKDAVKASVSFVLSAEVETLALTGAASIDGAGNGLDNTITGNSGANVLSGGDGADALSGGGGDDQLIGGAGKDRLTGGDGADTFIFEVAVATGADSLSDFAHGVDRLAFRAADYGLSAGPLSLADLVFGTAAVDAHAEFIYDASRKTLLWDADGAGGVAAVTVCTFATAVTLSATDFLIIA